MTNGHVHPVMRSALNALVPTMTGEERHAIWMNLNGALEAIQAEEWDLIARKHDVMEQMARIQGHDLWADYHRFTAEAARNPSPEAKQIAHHSYVAAMADQHLRNGSVPDGDDAAEIEEAMDFQRTTRAAG